MVVTSSKNETRTQNSKIFTKKQLTCIRNFSPILRFQVDSDFVDLASFAVQFCSIQRTSICMAIWSFLGKAKMTKYGKDADLVQSI